MNCFNSNKHDVIIQMSYQANQKLIYIYGFLRLLANQTSQTGWIIDAISIQLMRILMEKGSYNVKDFRSFRLNFDGLSYFSFRRRQHSLSLSLFPKTTFPHQRAVILINEFKLSLTFCPSAPSLPDGPVFPGGP